MVKNGQGTFTYSNGDKYLGQWKDSKYDGQGTFTYLNKINTGEWKDNNKHGKEFSYLMGSILGEWKDE